MGIVKEYSAKLHIGILEAVIIVFIVLVWLCGIYEAYFLTKLQMRVYKEDVSMWDWIPNVALIILGSFSAMTLPQFIKSFKSKVSYGGVEIVPLEITLVLMLIGFSVLVPCLMYFRCVEVLDVCLAKKIVDTHQYNLRLNTIESTIMLNAIADVLLGLWSLYEIDVHNNNLKTIGYGKYKKGKSKSKTDDTPKPEDKKEEPKPSTDLVPVKK